MFPGGFAIFEARSGEREILEMERAKIFFELGRGQCAGCQSFLRAAIKRSGKVGTRQAPAACVGLPVKPLETGDGSLGRGRDAGSGLCVGAVWDLLSHTQLRYLEYGRASNVGPRLSILRA